MTTKKDMEVVKASDVTAPIGDSAFDENGALKTVTPPVPVAEKKAKKTPAKKEKNTKAIELHKNFVDALGKDFTEKKTDGFYTIQRKDGTGGNIFLRDATGVRLSIASRHLGDTKARSVETAKEAKQIAEQIVKAIQKKNKSA